MSQPRLSLCSLLLLFAASATAASGQYAHRTFNNEAHIQALAGPLIGSVATSPTQVSLLQPVQRLPGALSTWDSPSTWMGGRLADAWQPPLALRGRQASATHTHKLAGFGAGFTFGAVLVSLDEVVGSGCTGSGPYLNLCRGGFVAAATVVGGVGALVGMLVQTEQPPGRTTRVLVGSALGTVGALVVSIIGCEQENWSNPELLCGYDGMVSARAAVAGAAVGGILGALLGGGSESLLQVSHLGPVSGHGGRVGLAAAFTLRPSSRSME